MDGANAGSTNPISVTMNSDHSLHAVFIIVSGVPEYPAADISIVAATFTFLALFYLTLKGKKQNRLTSAPHHTKT